VHPDDDDAAVDRLLAGDVSAFEAIVRRWQHPLVNLAYRFCRDRSRAEDMAQEAFLRVFRSLRTWKREAAFSTWLFAIATRLYCSEMRRIPAATVPLDEIAEIQAPIRTERAFDDHAQVRFMRRTVLALPAKYREPLILFYFHDMDITSTARSLGLPEGTVKARLSRARGMLKQKMSNTRIPLTLGREAP
jgi:RNA polymerase sigma-70 factor (ECF subfamily)